MNELKDIAFFVYTSFHKIDDLVSITIRQDRSLPISYSEVFRSDGNCTITAKWWPNWCEDHISISVVVPTDHTSYNSGLMCEVYKALRRDIVKMCDEKYLLGVFKGDQTS
jgi:hypothetical protein